MSSGHTQKITRLLFILFLLLFSCEKDPFAGDTEGFIRMVVDDISLSNLVETVEDLSGATTVTINGNSRQIFSRHKDYPGNDLAADYIKEKLGDYGFEVQENGYGVSIRNVIAVQRGSRWPLRYYIVCAHYDSEPDSSIAPGADDNASGVAAVLETARVLSAYQPEYSIVYAFWDEEEQGLLGSGFYAWEARQYGDDIRGVINSDMLGYDSNDDGRFFINVKDTANSIQLAETIRSVSSDYIPGLEPVTRFVEGGSDYATFWYHGYGAVGIVEMYGEDWNPAYHTAGDKVEKFNLEYFHNLSKLVAATAASLAY